MHVMMLMVNVCECWRSLGYLLAHLFNLPFTLQNDCSSGIAACGNEVGHFIRSEAGSFHNAEMILSSAVLGVPM